MVREDLRTSRSIGWMVYEDEGGLRRLRYQARNLAANSATDMTGSAKLLSRVEELSGIAERRFVRPS